MTVLAATLNQELVGSLRLSGHDLSQHARIPINARNTSHPQRCRALNLRLFRQEFVFRYCERQAWGLALEPT